MKIYKPVIVVNIFPTDAKVVEWYGGKEKYLSVVNNPISKDVADSYNKRIEAVLQKLIAKRNCDVNSSEVQEVVEEYGLLMKQFSQIKEEQPEKTWLDVMDILK